MNLTDWIDEHYDIGPARESGAQLFVCKRCGQQVGYVTKHAVTRHGDDRAILPPANDTHPELSNMW